MQTSMSEKNKPSSSSTTPGSSLGSDLSVTGPRFQVSFKKDQVISIDPEAPLWEAVQLMKQHQVGDVIVIDKSSRQSEPVGMITDRDIALCMSENVEFKSLRVSDVMTESVHTASMDDDLIQIIHLMKEQGITRVPLLDENRQVAGVVTAKNILEILASCFSDMTQISEKQHQNELQQH